MTGNGPEGLKKLIGQMNDIARGRFLPKVTQAIAHESVVRIKDCFDKSKSPYGDRWEPVARGGKPLLDTGRLRAAFIDNTLPWTGRVAIWNPTVYAELMNYGGIVEAKNAPYLTFPVKRAGAALAVRGGVVTKRGRSSKQWVRVKFVTIKPRQFMPDDGASGRGIPRDWLTRYESIASKLFGKAVGQPALG